MRRKKMLFWCLLGIAGTKLASLELLLAPPCCRCCPVEALCSTSLFARCLHPKQAEYGIFNHAQECIWYSFHLWKNKPLKGTAGRENSHLQREALPRWKGGISASLFGGRCLAERGGIISSWLFIPVGCCPPSQDPANEYGLPNWDGGWVAKSSHLPDVSEMSNISLTCCVEAVYPLSEF